jgi:hypothetical protein
MKWKWLFVNGYECKSLISTMTEFLNACQDGVSASTWSGIALKYNDISVEEMICI